MVQRYRNNSLTPVVYSITFGMTRHFVALLRHRNVSTIIEIIRQDESSSHPALVASRFNESSLSPIARTWPLRAKDVEVGRALPFSSTSTTLSWTEAWSFEVINWSVKKIKMFSGKGGVKRRYSLVAAHLRGT